MTANETLLNHYEFIPDIVAIGKGLGNGYPVSCVAIAKEVIGIIEDDLLLERAVGLGDMIQSRMNETRYKYGKIRSNLLKTRMVIQQLNWKGQKI